MIVYVRSQLPETVMSICLGDKGSHLESLLILQVDDCIPQWLAIGIQYTALYNAH